MKNRINWIRSSLAIMLIVSFTYVVVGDLLEKYYRLLFRDWILTLVIIILTFCGLIIEIVILGKLNDLFEKSLLIPNMLKAIIHIISTLLIILVNLFALLIFILIIGFNYREKGVEIYNGEKYVVRSSFTWLDNPKYYYNPYKNFFVYDAAIKYSGEVKWEDYIGIEIDDKKEPDPIPIMPEEDTDDVIEEEVIEITPSNVEYVQKLNKNLSYGFYLMDRAGHQYSYGFVQSDNGGLLWELIYQFPATSEMYYGHFLDKELGFINFGSSEGLSLLMTSDGGLTWENVSINLSEENKNMLYVKDIKKMGEEIELILGGPSWSKSHRSIRYISVDKGLSWDLQM